ncbi:MAG: ZIP family metal transporter [Alphaproteobacteria bacterium]
MSGMLLDYAGTLPLIAVGALASLVAGLATGVGAIPVLFGGTIGQRRQDTMLGFAAGVMLAATAFSLVLPSVESGAEVYGSRILAGTVTGLSILAGAVGLTLLHRYAPHEHFIKGREGADIGHLRRLWLFVIAITLHNFPEGLAVGVGFGGGDIANGMALMTGIGLQNMPEGLAVALALRSADYSRGRAFAVAVATGLVEPVGGLLGIGAVSFSDAVLPVGLALAGGAMLFVISHEIIPETHRRGSDMHATAGLMVGFVTMMFLDVLLG